MLTKLKHIRFSTLSLMSQQYNSFSFVNAQDYNKEFKEKIENQNVVKSNKEYRFAVVGSGPAGFYCAKQILKNVPKVRVDIYDRNPHPFGLVRTGVAPDHPEMKKIEIDYSEVLKDDERCRFFGNVWVGKNGGVPIQKLKDMYSGVVLSYGATGERELGLPNENTLHGVLSSRQMANWYNGSLDRDLQCEQDLDLENVKHMAIIGNGNVAMDISRVLLKDPMLMAPYDIPLQVLENLKKSNIQTIQVIARRGLVQSSFTIKEIREISRISGVKFYGLKSEFEESLTEASLREMDPDFSAHSRGYKRKTDFVKESTNLLDSEDQLNEVIHSASSEKRFILRFLQNPVELLGTKRVTGVKLQKQQLEGQAGKQKAVSTQPPQFTEVNCQLLVKSIGYKSKPIEGIPFDKRTNTVPNHQGCVINEKGEPQPGFYVSGWLKRGPVGIIDSTLRDSVETFRIIKHHLECDLLAENKTTVEDVLNTILPPETKIVTYEDWEKIDQVERQRGKQYGKTREKILDKDEMLKIASSDRESASHKK